MQADTQRRAEKIVREKEMKKDDHSHRKLDRNSVVYNDYSDFSIERSIDLGQRLPSAIRKKCIELGLSDMKHPSGSQDGIVKTDQSDPCHCNKKSDKNPAFSFSSCFRNRRERSAVKNGALRNWYNSRKRYDDKFEAHYGLRDRKV